MQACRLRDCIAIHQGVLQVERGLGREKCIATCLNDLGHCIAIQWVYCDSGLGGWTSSCVATRPAARPQHGPLLGHNTAVEEPGHDTGRAAGARGAWQAERAGVWGELARGRRARQWADASRRAARALRHGSCACDTAGWHPLHGVSEAMTQHERARLSVLAGSAGPSWCTVHLAQL